MRGSTKLKMLVAFCALERWMLEARIARHARGGIRRERDITAASV
jgi:hypothetical protein